MYEATDNILKWTEEIENFNAAEWDRLPEIYLYMDQVLTYMDKQLHLFERDENACLLTSSMINNYVKDGFLPRPTQKKYSRDHLAILTVVCLLKQVLSIQDIAYLVRTLLQNASERDMYNRFCAVQSDAVHDVCERIKTASPQGEAELMRLVIELSVEANARRTASERILSEIAKSERKRAEAEREQEKEKGRKKQS